MSSNFSDHQELIINLSVDLKYRHIFFRDTKYRNQYLKELGCSKHQIEKFKDLEEISFNYQYIATNNMNFDTYKENLPLIFNRLPNIRTIFNNYTLVYPIKYLNRYEELLRFLSFVGNSIGAEISVNSKEEILFLINLIRYYYGILTSSLSKIRYGKYLEYLTNSPSTDKGYLLANPTLYHTYFNFDIEKLLLGETHIDEADILEENQDLLFYYALDEKEVSLTFGNSSIIKILALIENKPQITESFILQEMKEQIDDIENLVQNMLAENLIFIV